MSSGLHGYLVIDKPAGWTSHDVVGRLRRLLGERKIGHAGTLDPAATGVLPVAVGDATKTLEYLTEASKTYLAEITFGVETDSYDGDGRVTRVNDASRIEHGAVCSALLAMEGPQQQLPPMHSAIKIGGKRLYEAARRGEDIDRPLRSVSFHALELVEWVPPVATVFVDCSKGTYVRTLAHDLGRHTGLGAYLSGLIRLRSGPFSLYDAWTIDELQSISESGCDLIRDQWPVIALHPDVASAALPVVVLENVEAKNWAHGKAIDADGLDVAQVDGVAFRTYDAQGRWIGTGRVDEQSGAWRPAKVVAPPVDTSSLSVEGSEAGVGEYARG